VTVEISRIPTIIPIAGGKGGVGKSLFTACLTRHLAAMGHYTTAVDLDLGGSNLHSFFGFDNIHPGVGDYLSSKGRSLDEFKVALPGSENARFIPGDGLRPFLANISHGHKMRLLRDLTRINADIVLLDLGAGSSYNTLDFFRVWGRGILLTTPEHTAIMNMMSFVKNVVLRIVAKGSSGNTFMEEIANCAGQQSIQGEIRTVPEMLDEMEAISAKRTESIRQQLSNLHFDLIVNQVREPADLQFVMSVQANLQKRLGVKVNWQGCFFDQPQVRFGLHRNRGDGDLPCLAGLDPIAGRIARGEVVSSESLLVEAQELYRQM
jgi:flagellar biosynthesis protein FlhG